MAAAKSRRARPAAVILRPDKHQDLLRLICKSGSPSPECSQKQLQSAKPITVVFNCSKLRKKS
jgi:hypothetical protein